MNGFTKFDLDFLKLENRKKNIVFSPLSIKYGLKMLEEGANGETKEQIVRLIKDIYFDKVISSKNVSIANGLFIKDSFKDVIKQEYIGLLKDKYQAEVKLDSFENAQKINAWIKEKTLGIIPSMLEDNEVKTMIVNLINALVIDMEWKNPIVNEKNGKIVEFKHENIYSVDAPKEVSSISFNSTEEDKYSGMWVEAKINNCDIVSLLGEENIIKNVKDSFWKKMQDENERQKFKTLYPNMTEEEWLQDFLKNYIEEVNENYHKYGSSTDFSIYDDENVLAFSKDLEEYDETSLQYVGIMPKNIELEDYINSISSDSINEIVSKLKSINSENFKEGVATVIEGYIPKFKFKFDLDFIKDLKNLGISNVFNANLSDLSNIAKIPLFVSDARHSADIEFSQSGIKAAAVTIFATRFGCAPFFNRFSFDHILEIPIERISVDFNKPFLFLIRNKKSGETWFAGTVYEPYLWNDEMHNMMNK